MVDHRDKERHSSRISVQRIVKLELFLVIGFEFVHLLGHTRLGSMNLSISLRVKSLQFLLVGFCFACSNVTLQSGGSANARLILGLNEQLEVRLGGRIVADLR